MKQFSEETQAAFRELFTAIEKQYGPIESVHFCTSFEGSPEWTRLMESNIQYCEVEGCTAISVNACHCARWRYAWCIPILLFLTLDMMCLYALAATLGRSMGWKKQRSVCMICSIRSLLQSILIAPCSRKSRELDKAQR